METQQAYRLLSTPNIIVDVYKDNAVIHVFGRMPDLQKFEASIRKRVPVKDFFYKDRSEKSAGEAMKSPHKEIFVEENGHRFLINLSDYLDTGLFLDHRDTRHWIESQSKAKVVLNTFAYTGSFTVYAAAGGANKTYSVDLSKTYCEWIKKNLALNGLPLDKNWIFKMDTLEFFKYAKKKGLSFDVIIIDPPTFSKNKGGTFSVERDHPRLLNEALELLNKGGFILFSNNCQGFRLQKEKLHPCRVRPFNLTPEDFKGTQPHHCFLIEKM